MAVIKTGTLYMKINAAGMQHKIKKDCLSLSDRNAGFCSGSSESGCGDDLVQENVAKSSLLKESIKINDLHKKSIRKIGNKRKTMEPSKVTDCSAYSSKPLWGPLKKRIRYTSSADSAVGLTPPSLSSPPYTNNPLPSSLEDMSCSSQSIPRQDNTNPAYIFGRHPGVTTFHRDYNLPNQTEQTEPLDLVARLSASTTNIIYNLNSIVESHHSLSLNLVDETVKQKEEDSQRDNNISPQLQQLTRNYKNMSRERRIEANARERTRVHTISAAYENLRRAIPAFASSQKLSKLSVLQVACSYILTLSRMTDQDYSSGQCEPRITDCIAAITSTIQTEGKAKRKLKVKS